MKKIISALLLGTSVLSSFGITILSEGFESPTGFIPPGRHHFVSGSIIPGWQVIDDGRGEKPFLLDEARLSSLGIEFFDKQALYLNEGSGIETTISLISGQEYTFSIWGYQSGFTIDPLAVTIGTATFGLQFEQWNAGGLKERSFSFIADETDENALLRIFNPATGVDYRQRAIDNISIATSDSLRSQSTNVPEGGATIALLGIGLAGLLGFRSRQK